MSTKNEKSILEMGRGGFLEQVDFGMAKVIDNILDPNTKATDKREITITLFSIPIPRQLTSARSPSPYSRSQYQGN